MLDVRCWMYEVSRDGQGRQDKEKGIKEKEPKRKL
jgi:hypothetical protein